MRQHPDWQNVSTFLRCAWARYQDEMPRGQKTGIFHRRSVDATPCFRLNRRSESHCPMTQRCHRASTMGQSDKANCVPKKSDLKENPSNGPLPRRVPLRFCEHVSALRTLLRDFRTLAPLDLLDCVQGNCSLKGPLHQNKQRWFRPQNSICSCQRPHP